jgi:hypothetical protein
VSASGTSLPSEKRSTAAAVPFGHTCTVTMSAPPMPPVVCSPIPKPTQPVVFTRNASSIVSALMFQKMS